MKNIKKFALILAVIMMIGLLSGCGQKGTTLKDIQKAGELVVATSPDFPPFESLQGDGSVVGIEIDLLNIICEKLGVSLKIEQMNFDSVLPGVQAGKFDLGASGISVTPEREKNVLFTDPYCMAAQAIVVTADSPITCKADLEGKTVSVQTGTTAESFCMDNGYTVSPFEANSDAQTALTAGKVDAWVIDDLTAADMVAVYNEENPGALVILPEAMTAEPYAFAFSFGSEELVAEINAILTELVKDGTVAEIFAANNAPYTAPEV